MRRVFRTKKILLTSFLSIYLISCNKNQPTEQKTLPIPADKVITPATVGKHGGAFVLADLEDPKTFNYLASNDFYSSRVQTYLFSALVGFDFEKEALVPELAKHWEISEDHCQYRFFLRQGIQWSDGYPFSADDVIFTLDAILTQVPEANGKLSFRYPTHYADHLLIDGQPVHYQKLDEFTIQITTARAFFPFLHRLTQIKILPKHRLFKPFQQGIFLQDWNAATALQTPEAIVGTGPFCLDKFTPGQRLVLKPNPYFWKFDQEGQRLPYVQHMMCQKVNNLSTAVFLFKKEIVDAMAFACAQVDWLRKTMNSSKALIFDRGCSSQVITLKWNDFSSKIYLKNLAFRKAIQHSIPRQQWIDTIYCGKGRLVDNLDLLPGKEIFDLEKAHSLLQEAGLKYKENKWYTSEGTPVRLRLFFPSEKPEWCQISFLLAENLQKLGLSIDAQALESYALKTHFLKNDYDLILKPLLLEDPNYLTCRQLLEYAGLDKNAVESLHWAQSLLELGTLYEKSFNLQARKACFAKIKQCFAENLPMLFLIAPHRFTGIKSQWGNIRLPHTASTNILWNIEEIYDKNS